MNWMNIARAAKVVALLAFVLPWLVVSCNATPLAEASGLDLVTGGIKAMNEQVSEDRSPQWWAVGALALIVLGLVLSFVLKPVRRAAAGLGGAAAGALVLCAVGMMLMIGSFKAEMNEKMNEPRDPDAMFDSAGMQQAMAEAIRFETKFGYWLELLALAGAAGAAFMAFSGRSLPSALTAAGRPATPADPDATYWDSIDKTDPASLEEYIYRFPDGRFVELARSRLAGPPPQA